MRRAAAIPLLVAAALAGGCGDDDEEAATGGTRANAAHEKPEPSPEQNPRSGTPVRVLSSDYGRILFGPRNRAIYVFDREQGSSSECYGACADAWPPVLTDGPPLAGKGADGSLLGTTMRQDGSQQVTYDGRPLYYYVDDPPGEVLCHGVAEFGGLWLVIRPDGAPVA
jgi:predicted lipoprotein with Yx(FWY)xxD motif